MLQVNALKPIEKPKELPRWPYKKHAFPNGAESYWIKWKLYPDDARFFSLPKTMIIKFDKELAHVDNENISALNEWKVTKLSYSSYLPRMCEELNFFEAMYDQEGELITALFRIKYMIDVDNISYTMKNFDAFKDLCYKTIFTPSMKEKITRMVDENYVDDIEAENVKNMKNPDMLSIMQRKKKSLEFLNVHVKAMIQISFGIKILSFIINHFAVMRSVNIQKNIDLFHKFYIDMFGVFDWDFDIYNKIYAYIENKVNSSYNFNKSIFEQQEIEGKDKSIIINQLMSRNVIIDNFIKFQMPQTWNGVKEQPNERVLSFLCSIINTHISIFIMQVFRRNLIETSIVPDADGNSKNDRYRASKMKINEEYVITCTMDMRQLVDTLFAKYEKDISPEEIDYYRKNLKPSRLQQLMIEIYFFNYTYSSQEFALLRNLDWYKLLLIMRKDIMRRFNVTKDSLLDSTLTLILTANIEETPVGEKMYLKDTKYLKDHAVYNELVKKYYSTIVDINEDSLKKFLITFVNSKYRFVLYEEQQLLDQEITLNKRELIDQLLNFLVLANTSFSMENRLGD
ncbi:MAG: hypothetical protein NC548_28345 [Lachnospiraceae bacterium]|nr:hypothetical protein [Lachnospiraceae bacterium]MCM1232000.1 hypothetical protein [Ruminococcus flavefaciens]